MAYNKGTIKLVGLVNDATTTIPAGYQIQDTIVENTTANAMTGGLKIGTTNGGTDVLLALAVGGNSLQSVELLKTVFSSSAPQTLYIQDVLGWNSANLNITFVIKKFTK